MTDDRLPPPPPPPSPSLREIVKLVCRSCVVRVSCAGIFLLKTGASI
jgi:hypothetical protein